MQFPANEKLCLFRSRLHKFEPKYTALHIVASRSLSIHPVFSAHLLCVPPPRMPRLVVQQRWELAARAALISASRRWPDHACPFPNTRSQGPNVPEQSWDPTRWSSPTAQCAHLVSAQTNNPLPDMHWWWARTDRDESRSWASRSLPRGALP